MRRSSWSGGVAQAALLRFGKQYELDPRIPSSALRHELQLRTTQLLRGWIRFRRPAFVGRKVQVRGRRNLHIARGATIATSCRIDAVGEWGVWLGERAKLGHGTHVTTTSHLSLMGKGLRLGADSAFGDYAHLGCSGGVTIGANVIAGPFVSVHSQEHVFASADSPIREQGTHQKGVVIEHDVWIGARVTILDGSHIGHGSVVAAGAVVSGTFEPYSLIGGVPARRLKGIRDHSSR